MSVLREDQLYTYATAAGFTGNARDTIVAISESETGSNISNPQAWFSGAYQSSSGGTDFTSWKSYKSGDYTKFLNPGGPKYTSPNKAGTQPSANVLNTPGGVIAQISEHSMLFLVAIAAIIAGFVIMTRKSNVGP